MSTANVEEALAAPAEDIGRELLALPEDQWFDRKSNRIQPRTLAEHIVAFGNAEGGTIVIGLRNGSVEGTDADPKRRNNQIQAAVDYTAPPVRVRHRLMPCVTDSGAADHLLVLDISPGETVHATNKDEVFLRIGDESRRLSFSQRQELNYDKGQAGYETRTVPESSWADLDHALVDGYTEASHAPDSRRLLDARGLLTGTQVTVAGCLLFAETPQRWFPEAYLRILRYRGRHRGTGAEQQVVHDERIEGPIPLMLWNAQQTISDHQPTRQALGPDGRFGSIPLIPPPVWLEAIVNAAVHRSYSLAGDHIRVEIFDDRIEVSSPGRFPGLVDIKDPLNVARFARNPRIARVCSDLRLGQELGEGVRRMFQEMRDAGLHDPAYRQTAGSVVVMLSAEPMHQALDARLGEAARIVIPALRAAERLSTSEIAELLQASQPTALKRLRELQEQGLVRWVGNSPRDPRAYWSLPSP
jgi:ATP-dependent DNA helicase RecG